MNFTPNQAQALAGRVQQQQVHQNPVTTSASGVPQGASMQKSGIAPNPSFPLNQQTGQKLNDDKNQIPPTSAHHQVQQPPQNNNNHGMGGPPHQLLNAQHQQNLNRNVNIGNQSFQQQQNMLPSMAAQGGQKIGQNFFHQMQQAAYQQNQFQSVALSQSQQPHLPLPSQSILQKLQASVQPPILKQQHPQQSMKLVTIQPPPVVSQHMQYSPTKPIHPQMKTTAKLASPGSQLHNMQKSPTALNPTASISPQATSQNKNVPSTPTTISAASPAVPQVLTATAPPPLSPVKSQTQITPVKLPVQSAPLAPTTVAATVSPVVPSPSVTITPQVKAVPAPVSITELSPAKPVELVKDSTQASPQLNKIVPKAIVDEKKPASAVNNAPPAQETNNKVEATPAIAAVPEKVQPAKTAIASPATTKSTMRLATVTPARQKKPPATIKKTVTAVTAQPSTLAVPKSPTKPVVQTAPKPVESPKSPAKKPQAAPQPAVTPKASLAPSTSSAQSNSSSNSATISPKTKRPRVRVQPYQSPTPELALVTKLSTQIANSSNKNGNDDKLTLFYKNEFLAVRNPEGTFYLCQAAHNVYKPASKIRIRWLNEKNEGKANANGDRTYTFDFFDVTDFECVLTTVDLDKIDSKNYELSKEEQARIESILKKAIDVEKGIVPRPTVTEENPDGLDLSLYKDEAQLDKSPRKRKRGQKSDEGDEDDEEDTDYEETPRKKKSAKKSPAAKPSRASSKKAAAYESTESDEENLMEIQKKAKKQAASPKPSTSKASEPMPSTSKAALATPASGRKRVARPVEEVPAKVAKPAVEKLETPKAAPKPKATPKAKPVKKAVAEISSPVVEKPTPEKKPVAKKAPAVVEEKSVEAKASPAKAVPEKVTPVKAPPKKKTLATVNASPSTSPADQPSTSRSRNTRSKK